MNYGPNNQQYPENTGFNTQNRGNPDMSNPGNYDINNNNNNNYNHGNHRNRNSNRNNFSGVLTGKEDFLRSGFVKKVYGILTVQLLITSVFIILSATSESYNKFLRENPGLLVLSIILYFVCAMVIICCRKVARSVPTNYILLFIVTIAFAYLA